MQADIGFIGAGNMGSALARAVCKSKGGAAVVISDHDGAKAARVAAELGCAVGDNDTIAASCSVIFLGVKPQMMPGMLAGLAPTLAKRKERVLLVSMAAGLSAARIRELAGVDCPIIRVMPNTPAAVGGGVLLYCGLDATDEELARFAAMMAPAGLVDLLPEPLIDAATAVSGCGPAFVYLFIEALADGGVACGLPRDKALAYAAQMVEGSARMVLQSGQHPGALKDAVCSPGGSTIQGVRALEAHGFRFAAMEAVAAAYEKTVELGKN